MNLTLAFDQPFGVDPVNLVCLLMKPVKAEFMPDIEENQEADRHSYGESQDIDERVDLAPPYVS